MKTYNKAVKLLQERTGLTLHNASYADIKRITNFMPISLVSDAELRVLLEYRAEYDSLDSDATLGDHVATL